MKVAQKLMKMQEDRHHRSSDIVVGDEVLFNVRKFDWTAFSTIHKLMQSYAGPFRVWNWTREHQTACRKFKDELIHHNSLADPNLNAPFHLHIDASSDALGATLSQEDGTGRLRIVCFTSRKLNPAERNYPTHKREMLAIVPALKQWKHHLLGAQIKAFTDNVTLKFWRTVQHLSPRTVNV